MKKPSSKKSLNLTSQTVRNLAEASLGAVPGAAMNNSFTRCYASGCTCDPYTR